MEFSARLASMPYSPLLTLSGELSHRHTEDLRRYIYQAARKSPWLIIDLCELRMISRAAIGILIAAQKLQEERGGSIILIMDKAPTTMIERILCLGELMPVVNDLEEARDVTRSSIKAFIARERAIEVLLAARERPIYRPPVSLFNQFELN
ncbi:MAG: STAS domain-containing protein [Candidatus Aquicultorales bacterium]